MKKLESATQLLQAQAPPNADITTAVVDITDEAAVEKFASSLDDDWHGLVVSAAGRAPHGPVLELPTEKVREMMESKVWTAYHCAKYIGPRLQDGGAVVLVAGILNRRPGLNCATLLVLPEFCMEMLSYLKTLQLPSHNLWKL